MTEPIDPDRLARLLDDAVRQVTVPAGALDRIHQGVRRRRAVHQAGAVLLVLAALAGGGVTGLAVASGGGPAGPAPAAAPSAGSARLAGPTATSDLDDLAAPARIQPYLPPPSLSAVSGKDLGTGVSNAPGAGAAIPAASNQTTSGLLIVAHVTHEHRLMN